MQDPRGYSASMVSGATAPQNDPLRARDRESDRESDRMSDRMSDRDAEHWPGAWVACALAAVLALCAWQRQPDWTWLIAALVATGASMWAVSRVRVPRGWALASSALLALTSLLAAGENRELLRIANDWPAWSANERENRATRVAAQLTAVSEQLRNAVDRVAADSVLMATLLSPSTSASGAGATNASTETRRTGGWTVARLTPPLDANIESALLIFRDTVLVARAGQLRTRVAPTGVPGIRLVDEAFYSSLVVRSNSPDGRLHLVAVALVSAVPPADRFARALTQTFDGSSEAMRTIIEAPDSTHVESGVTVMVVTDGDRRLARVRALARTEGATRLAFLQTARARTGIPLAVAMLLLLVTSWRRPARTLHRMGVAALLLLAVAVAPLSSLSNVSVLFDASSYFAAAGGPWTANVASLLITVTLGLTLVLLILRSGRVTQLTRSRSLAGGLVLACAGLGPFVLRDLARGIALPADGVSTALWVAWQLAIALAGASVLLVGAAAGRTVLGARRGLPAAFAPTLAIGAAICAPLLLRAPGVWPAWYPALWILAIATLALTRRSVALVTGAAVIAGAGAVTLTWGATVRARMSLAQFDLTRLSAVDENALRLLSRFANSLEVPSLSGGAIGAQTAGDTTHAKTQRPPAPRERNGELLRRYAASELALAGYPARLARWDPATTDTPLLDVALVPVADTIGAQAILASIARVSKSIEIRTVEDGPTTLLIAAVPDADGRVTTIAVPPRTRLLPTDPFGAITGVAAALAAEAPYRLTLAAAPAADTLARELDWRRRGDAMHGDGLARGGGETRAVHVEVALRGLDTLLPRGTLLVLLDAAVVLLLWVGSAMAHGAFGRWFRVRRTRLWRSYRARLSAALLAFFVAPAMLFGAWSWYRLQDDDQAARALVMRESLRPATNDAGLRDLGAAAVSVGSPLFLYRNEQLIAASDSLLQALSPLGQLLPISRSEAEFDDEPFSVWRIPVGRTNALVGFRRVSNPVQDLVIATPARGDEFALDARRRDLGVLVLFAVAIGALAALWLSGAAARSLARPVGALREAALAIAGGGDAHALGTAPASEFSPVYLAFGRMAEDLSTSRAALEAAQRRTAAVLQNVATGVVAMRDDGDILIANPRAEQLLRTTLTSRGVSLSMLPNALAPVATRCVAFLSGHDDETAFDETISGRQLRGRLTRLPGGAVLTLDDVTELASAQRVLAWGEMARQVAHEIKNPLTPIRLGVQHLRRAFRDGRGDFATILDSNVTRVLEEIDHLDEIARAFSRYGTAPDQRPPAVPIDVVDIVRDVLALEQLGESGVAWSMALPPDVSTLSALGQRDELKEVLLNLLENARMARATAVQVTIGQHDADILIDVIDDGVGIAPEVLPHVFEPHFSTRTSGSGLGLAISRRLIEGWGGRITLESRVGHGTTLHVRLLSG